MNSLAVIFFLLFFFFFFLNSVSSSFSPPRQALTAFRPSFLRFVAHFSGASFFDRIVHLTPTQDGFLLLSVFCIPFCVHVDLLLSSTRFLPLTFISLDYPSYTFYLFLRDHRYIPFGRLSFLSFFNLSRSSFRNSRGFAGWSTVVSTQFYVFQSARTVIPLFLSGYVTAL